MGKGIAISPINTKQVNKVLKNKRSRGNIHGSFRKDHKANVVKDKKDRLQQLALAAKQEALILKEKMYQKLFRTEEPVMANSVVEKIDTLA